MQRITYGIGIEYDELGNRLRDVLVKTKRASRLVAESFGGCFITGGNGAWVDPEGNLIEENGITITVDVPGETSEAVIDDVAEDLRRLFNQTAVHVCIVRCTTWERHRDTPLGETAGPLLGMAHDGDDGGDGDKGERTLTPTKARPKR